jgi:hypothetical protein
MIGSGRLETLVAALLAYGSWLASAAIGLGLVLALIDSSFATRNPATLPNMRIATMGIVLFIGLPILRVLLMLLVFIRERDFRLAVAAALVLAIILVGIVLAFRATSGIAGQRSPRPTGTAPPLTRAARIEAPPRGR